MAAKKPPKDVPTSFNLFGHKIKVVWRNDLVETESALGRALLSRNLIELQTPGKHCDASNCRQTFWHEVSHFFTYYLGYDDLTENEQFVDQLGQSLNQIFVSMKFAPAPSKKKKPVDKSRPKPKDPKRDSGGG